MSAPRRRAGCWAGVRRGDWEKFFAPWRPSRGDLANYLSALRPLEPRRVLVLGSTPELRLLAASLGARATVMDLSPGMLGEMGRYLPASVRLNEIKVEADWLSAPMGRGLYDAVLGDLVLRLVRPGLRAGLLGKIAASLVKKGRFITRLHLNDASLAGLPAERVLRRSPRGLKPYPLASLLRGRFFDAGIPAGAALFRLCASRLGKAPARALAEVMRAPAPFYRTDAEEAGAVLRGAFRLVRRRAAADYPDAAFYPVYTLEKK